MAGAGLSPTPPGPLPRLYPVALDLRGRRCLVVGGREVAAAKAANLLSAGATVVVVAPEVDPAIGTLDVTVERRPYRPGEAADYRLVLTATGRAEVDRQVFQDAERAGVWVNSADDPDHCSFLLPSIHRQGPVTVAVSTAGASPALAVWLRRRLEPTVGAEMGSLAQLLAEGRQQLVASGRPTASVDWAALLDGPLPELVAAGRLAEARRLVAEACGPH